MTQVCDIKLKQHKLIVYWQDGTKSQHDYLWLRDNCPAAFHPDTHERNFDLLSVSEDINPVDYQLSNGQLLVTWSEQNHHSAFSLQWLRRQAENNQANFLMMPEVIAWQGNPNISNFSYDAIIKDDKVLYQWLYELAQYGISMIQNMPSDESAMKIVAERIGHLRRTNFGLCFNVLSKPNPNNQAYTSEELPLHTDLPNQETPPGYQFLHCLENTAKGGESTFVDGFSAAQILQQHHPQDFALLSQHKIPFRFHDDDCDIREMRPVISMVDGEVNEIIFNAHLADSFNLPQHLMRPYYLAYRRFITILRERKLLFGFKLERGQMVVFDNRRVLHGRQSFDANSGKRHLKGCYVDRTEFKSRLRMLQKTHR